LRRLRDARERLRFMALEDPFGRVPMTVRVATRAAAGPDLPGLRVGEYAAWMPAGNGMGIDLAAAVGRVLRPRAGQGRPVCVAFGRAWTGWACARVRRDLVAAPRAR
jgi:hypothetical protein